MAFSTGQGGLCSEDTGYLELHCCIEFSDIEREILYCTKFHFRYIVGQWICPNALYDDSKRWLEWTTPRA